MYVYAFDPKWWHDDCFIATPSKRFGNASGKANDGPSKDKFKGDVMKTRLIGVIASICLVAVSPANAALIANADGTLVYDDVLDVTWISNAALGGTFTSWAAAKAWADNLDYGGFSDWRLPSAYDPGTSTICEGFNCTLSEFGRMFYVNFGTTAGSATYNCVIGMIVRAMFGFSQDM